MTQWILSMEFKLGDTVLYIEDNKVYVIEKDYGCNVYLIGNTDSFVDMVPESMLKEVNNGV